MTSHADSSISPVRSTTVRCLALAGAMVLAAVSCAAVAQKSSPRPLEPYVEPVLDARAWAEVYDLMNRPRLLVLCGRGNDRHQAMDPAQVLSNLDSTSVTQKIRSALISELNTPGADIDVVDDNALRAALTRLRSNMAQAGEADAVELLRQHSGADLLLLVRLVEAGAEGSPFSVVVESSDLARGRKGISLPFDWKGGIDAVNIKANARAVAIRFVDDLAARANDPVRYTVQVMGATEMPMQRDVLAALNTLPGLRGNARTRGTAAVPGDRHDAGDAVQEFDIAFIRGSDPDPTQIAADLAESLRTRFGINASPRQVEAGRIALRVEKPAEPAPTTNAVHSPPSTGRTDRAGAQTDAALPELASLYARRGSPRVVVLFNRAATIEEWDDWRRSPVVSGENVVIIGDVSAEVGQEKPAANGGETFVTPSILDVWSRQVEQGVSRALAADAGISRQASPDVARASLLASRPTGERYMGSDRLLGLLKSENIADVAVIGYGRIISGYAGFELVYTIETVELANSRRLATATVTSPVRGMSASDLVRKSAESFAARAAAQVADDLRAAWALGSEVSITLRGEFTDDDVASIADAVRELAGGLTLGTSSFGTSEAGAAATFSARWTGRPEEIGSELRRAAKAAGLAFTFVVTSRNAESVTIDVTR